MSLAIANHKNEGKCSGYIQDRSFIEKKIEKLYLLIYSNSINLIVHSFIEIISIETQFNSFIINIIIPNIIQLFFLHKNIARHQMNTRNAVC